MYKILWFSNRPHYYVKYFGRHKYIIWYLWRLESVMIEVAGHKLISDNTWIVTEELITVCELLLVTTAQRQMQNDADVHYNVTVHWCWIRCNCILIVTKRPAGNFVLLRNAFLAFLFFSHRRFHRDKSKYAIDALFTC